MRKERQLLCSAVSAERFLFALVLMQCSDQLTDTSCFIYFPVHMSEGKILASNVIFFFTSVSQSVQIAFPHVLLCSQLVVVVLFSLLPLFIQFYNSFEDKRYMIAPKTMT